jgi:phenylpropionate dioxygenase-like ring-hydroxylating dioxygenase large terminal subunit
VQKPGYLQRTAELANEQRVQAMTAVDPVLFDDWHPVADAGKLQRGAMQVARLLDYELIVWRSADGKVHAWDDRCPHRGARLSLGRVEQDRVVCAYHGWQFDGSGQCRLQPAQPHVVPPKSACAKYFHACEAYGLVWVCLGEPARELPPFPEHRDSRLRSIVGGPHRVSACGPRIIENFLDMAHFGFVHNGILGDPEHAEVPEYSVSPYDDGLGERGMEGVIATECFAYQPLPSLPDLSGAADGSMVAYTYRVLRPLTAILTKLPEGQAGIPQAISIHVQPIDDETCDVWVVMAVMTDAVATDEELRARQYRIFAQDIQILESQRPKQILLEPGIEVPQRADRLSAAYRRMLKRLGMRYGVM